jgi:membrane peptidoglycan carboxypeptidase
MRMAARKASGLGAALSAASARASHAWQAIVGWVQPHWRDAAPRWLTIAEEIWRQARLAKREAVRTCRLVHRQVEPVLSRLLPEAVRLWRKGLATAVSLHQSAAAWLTQVQPQIWQARDALHYQLEQAELVRPHLRALRDRRGRRLRASAYARHRGAARRGGDMAGTLYAVRTRRICTFLATTSVLGLGSFLTSSQAFINFSAYLPDVHNLRTVPLPQDTMLYASDGSLLADIHDPGQLHYEQSLGHMGKLLPEAAVAIEDANFWGEPGVDPQGIARAAATDFQQGRSAQGASTITQQLVKLRLLKDFSVTYQRKIKEAILAIQVEHTFTKRQILEMYLNTVHFGNQSIGAEAAAQDYFRKDTQDLDLAEASMLAGIPQNPFYNDPLLNWDSAKARQRQVLDAMVHRGMVTRQQARQAFAKDLKPELSLPPDSVRAAPEFVWWTVGQLAAKYGRQAAFEGGLRVYTTINLGLQAMAQEAVRNNVDKDRSRNVQQGAMTAIDPHTGDVLAMVGSAYRDQEGGLYNYAADVPRSPGSSFKIFTYTAAIESRHYVMDTPIPDVPITVSVPGQDPNYQPKNYDGGYHGTCGLQQCMGNSYNVPAVEAEVGTGIDQVVNMARKLGAPPYMSHQDSEGFTQTDPPSSFSAALTLGGYGETPLQMATGAATIADMGVYHPATAFVRVTNSDGDEIFRYDPLKAGQQVLDPRVAYIMQSIMSNDDNRTRAFGRASDLTLPGRLVGAKTGTAEEFRDAWTVGYTPAMASAFWFGNPDYSPMSRGFDAIFAAAPAWHAFMLRSLDAVHESPGDWFAPPPGLEHDGNVWLLPGTAAHQPQPPLPVWAHLGGAPARRV